MFQRIAQTCPCLLYTSEARARKAQQQAAPVDAPAAEPVDPRKAAVEASIARAKARKAEQQAAPCLLYTSRCV